MHVTLWSPHLAPSTRSDRFDCCCLRAGLAQQVWLLDGSEHPQMHVCGVPGCTKPPVHRRGDGNTLTCEEHGGCTDVVGEWQPFPCPMPGSPHTPYLRRLPLV